MNLALRIFIYSAGLVFIAACQSCFARTSADPLPLRALLAPSVETVLAGQTSGRIDAMHVDNGDTFTKGDVLVAFDCVIPKAEQRKARATLKRARATLASNREMRRHRAVGLLEVETSEAEVNYAEAELALRRAYVNRCETRAPFSGRVIKRLAQPYQYVAVGTPLLEILDDRRLKMELFVPSAWSQWLKPRMEFKVSIDETGKDYTAVVKKLGAKVIPVSQTLPITAEIPGEHQELLAGMSGNAVFRVPSEK